MNWRMFTNQLIIEWLRIQFLCLLPSIVTVYLSTIQFHLPCQLSKSECVAFNIWRFLALLNLLTNLEQVGPH